MVRVDHLAGLDRQLGYFGEDRFSLFFYDDLADGLVWKDRQGYGFGSWVTFDEKVEPLLRKLGWETNQVVLLIDRSLKQAYLVKRNSQIHWNGIVLDSRNMHLSIAREELAVA